MARYLVQGVDVWLNNPRRPLEASGTSGMKVPVNGGINLSVLDGWWCEGYQGDNGWAIGAGEEYDDQAYQDEVESTALYDLLEREIVPLFYDRGSDDVPREWIADHEEQHAHGQRRLQHQPHGGGVHPALLHPLPGEQRTACGATRRRRPRAGELARRSSRALARSRSSSGGGDHEAQPMGSHLPVADLELGELGTEDVLVEIYHGLLDADGSSRR